MVKDLKMLSRFQSDSKYSCAFSLLFVVLVNIYYTTKGWAFSGKLVNIILLIGVLSGIIDGILKFKKSKIYIILGIVFFVIITQFFVNKDTRLIVAFIGACVALNTSLKKIFKWLFLSKIPTFIFCYFVGGYVHLNYTAINIGLILLLFSIIYFKKKTVALKISLLILFVGYWISKSGAFLICSFIGIVLFYLLNEKGRKFFVSLKCTKYLLPIILVLNVVLCWLYVIYVNKEIDFSSINRYTPDLIVMILSVILKGANTFFHGRIGLGGFSLYYFGISFFGGNIDYSVNTGLQYFVVDSGLILLLQNWGILITILINIAFVYLMDRMIKENTYSLLVYSTIILIWAFNEDVLISIGTNYMFYMLGSQLGRDYRKLAMKG